MGGVRTGLVTVVSIITTMLAAYGVVEIIKKRYPSITKQISDNEPLQSDQGTQSETLSIDPEIMELRNIINELRGIGIKLDRLDSKLDLISTSNQKRAAEVKR